VVSKASKKYIAVLLGILIILGITGCSQSAADAKMPANEPTVQISDGLVLEGEGPFPAVLLARSKNTLSNEENQFVLQEISQELDKIMDLASQLEVIDDEVIGQ
jgi:hypothetical protein